MRVRMIRPAYWTDADLHTRLSADQREFYIGLWMLADDDGYVAWDIDRVGAELYPYRSAPWRRSHLSKWLGDLGDHVRLLACGAHVVVPTLKKYQTPPKPSYPNRRSHDANCAHMGPAGASGGHVGPARGFSKEEGGREGNGFEGGRHGANGLTPDEETTALGAKIAAAAGSQT